MPLSVKSELIIEFAPFATGRLFVNSDVEVVFPLDETEIIPEIHVVPEPHSNPPTAEEDPSGN